MQKNNLVYKGSNKVMTTSFTLYENILEILSYDIAYKGPTNYFSMKETYE